ncbi:TPA: YgiT-type zinc finger protein [Salmonella enterica]|nr:YgiT-type zinc finger protein [Salmonella enterica]
MLLAIRHLPAIVCTGCGESH